MARDDGQTTAHQMLRRATGAAHERLDGRFGRYDLSTPDGYAAFLTAHARALPAVERALDAGGMAGLIDDWGTRRRGHLIAADLAALGRDMPDPLPFPPIAGAASAWGVAYVVEGSRLGGALLARSLYVGAPRAYLATPLAPGAWRKFLASMDEALYPDRMHSPAIAAALTTFALFEQAAA